MALARTKTFTYEDYLRLPDDERYQVFNGVLTREPSPRPYHQTIAGELVEALRRFVKERQLGIVLSAPIDVVLSDDNVLQPDILFISRQRLEIVQDLCIRGAPDLVVEVLSPSTARRDRTLKTEIYARFGVKECWLADPDRKTVEVLVASASGFVPTAVYRAGDTLHSPLLPHLAIDLGPVFAWIR